MLRADSYDGALYEDGKKKAESFDFAAPYVVLIPAEHILADRGGIVAQML